MNKLSVFVFLFIVMIATVSAQSITYSPTGSVEGVSPYSFDYTISMISGDRGVTCDFSINDVLVATTASSNTANSVTVYDLTLAIGGFDGIIFYEVTGFGEGSYNSTVSIPATDSYLLKSYCTSSEWEETAITELNLTDAPAENHGVMSCSVEFYSTVLYSAIVIFLVFGLIIGLCMKYYPNAIVYLQYAAFVFAIGIGLTAILGC